MIHFQVQWIQWISHRSSHWISPGTGLS